MTMTTEEKRQEKEMVVTVVRVAMATTARKGKKQQKELVVAVIAIATTKTTTEVRRQEKELVVAVVGLAMAMMAEKERQGREGACCHGHTTCNSQQKEGNNKGAICGCRRNSNNYDSHRGKATKKEIVAAVVELAMATMATK